MIELPYEIWLKILSGFSKEEIWKLRSLNPAIYSIAMDRRYRTLYVSTTFRGLKTYIRNFIRFRDSEAAARVRKLIFDCGRGQDVFAERVKKSPGSNKDRVRTFALIDTPTHAAMVGTMASFTNVTTIEVKLSSVQPGYCYEDYIPLILMTFKACFSQLQSLHIYFSLERLHDILVPNLFFPCLSSLAINCEEECRPEGFWFASIATAAVVSFINRHRYTLTSVWLPPNVDLRGLDHIPSLRGVYVRSLGSPTHGAAIAQFLELNRENLRTIKINYSKYIEDIFRVFTGALPYLEVLSVACESYRDPPIQEAFDSTIDFIKRCSTSLISLKFGSFAWDILQLEGIFFGKLKYLDLKMNTLTPEILDFIASKMPNLNILDIYAVSLNCSGGAPRLGSNHDGFALAMAQRTYSSWRLQHLKVVFKWRGPWDSLPFSELEDDGTRATAKSIPSLKTLNGVKVAKIPYFQCQPSHLS